MNRASALSNCPRGISVHAPARGSSGPGRSQARLIRVFDALGAWQDRAMERRRLAGFDDRMLHDIGVDRAAAAAEAGKPFWRP